jgi:4a-hydroxytetrahydrobiopterin dehydratase
MSQMSRERLTDEGLRAGLAGLLGWEEAEGQIARTFTFPTYWAGVLFANKVADAAQVMDHHPDLLITYCKVRVSVSTHDAGGITELDLELAKRANALVH